MSKKIISVLLAVTMVLTILSGCGSSNNPSGETTAKTTNAATTGAPTTAAPKNYTLELYTHGNEPLEAAYNKVIENYTKENSNIKINYNVIPMDTFTTQLPILFSSKQPVDLINIHDRYIAPYLQYLSEAPAFVVEDMQKNAPASYEAGMINGKMYGYLYPDVNMMFVNKKIFKENNLQYPKTWDDLLAINKQLTKVEKVNGADVKKYGVNLWHVAGFFVFTTAFWNNVYESVGGQLLPPDGKVVINNEAGIKATKIFKEISHTDESFLNSFAAGNLAAMVAARWTISFVRTNAVEGLDFEVIPMPVSTEGKPLGQGYFQMVTVPNYRPEDVQTEAWKFNAYAHGDDGNYILETVGGCGDWRLDTIKKLGGEDPVITQGYDQAQYSSSPLIHEKWADIERIIGEWVEKCVYGSISAEEAMKGAQAELDKVLGQ